MRAFTAGTTEILRTDNERGVVTAKMTPDVALLIALACSEYLSEGKGNVHMRDTIGCAVEGFQHAGDGDELLRYAPITRRAASTSGLMQDCVREVRGWQLHTRAGLRWPRIAWSGIENAPDEFAGLWSDDQAVAEAMLEG